MAAPARPATQPSAIDHNAVTLRTWLAAIGEHDPAIIRHVLTQCRADPGALAYYGDLAARALDPAEQRLRKVLAMLEAVPHVRYAVCVSHPDADPVLITVGIRDVATCELEVAQASYDARLVLALLERDIGVA